MNFDSSDVQFSSQDIKRKIKLPTRLNEDLAELMGIMLGDGCIYIKESKKYEIIIYGHATEDKEYHEKIVSEIFYDNFNIKPNIKNIKGTNGIKSRVYSKAITYFLIKKLGITSGNKLKNNSKIPDYLFYAENRVFLPAIIRGLADTDFCVRFKKRKTTLDTRHHHPIIIGNFGSESLVKQIKITLNSIGINSHLEQQRREINGKSNMAYSVVIVGKKNLKRWMHLIGFNNPKHKTKYLIWKKHGFCPPKTTLKLREKALKENIDPEVLVAP